MSIHLGSFSRVVFIQRQKFNERIRKWRALGHWAPDLAGGHESAGSLEGVRVRVYFPRGTFRFWMWIVILLAVTGAGVHELNTSSLQSRLLAFYSSRLVYQVTPGVSRRIVFPKDGPFDVRRGYTRLPDFEERLLGQGFSVKEQATFSRDLARIAALGVTPPYREPDDAGLAIKSEDGALLYSAIAGDRSFKTYGSVPPVLVESILYMENRELGGEPRDVQDNPVIDWPRLGKAAASYLGKKAGLPVRLQGGSTLATQMEKYRHSPGGRTGSGMEKVKQMLAASLRVYREGRDTRVARQEIVVDYLNTVPLAAVPGYGEVNGLGNGLYAWFGLDLDDVCRELNHPSSPVAQARALKYVLTLLASVRAPAYFLGQHRAELESRVRYVASQLAKAGIIGHELAANVKKVQVTFVPHSKVGVDDFSPRFKAVSSMRVHLANLLGVPSLYDLSKLHLEADSTLDAGLQNQVLKVFEQLKDPKYLVSQGLYGDRLLMPGEDPGRVTYSFLLYESLPAGNSLVAQADTLDAPFDINEGVKLQLGSTAKLRVLANYLELMVSMHREFSALDPKSLQARAQQARDPLTRWAVLTLSQEPGLDLPAFLEKSMDRTYSANPGEVFFTGGGAHKFENFDPDDNGRILTIREATQHSTNLVFIRLMRDIVRYYEARLPYDTDQVLTNANDPVRRRLLQEIAEEEGQERLAQFFQSYRELRPAGIVSTLLGSRASDPRQLAMTYFAWHPDARAGNPEQQLGTWLRVHGLTLSGDQVSRLVRAYGNPRLTIADYGYLLGKHPLAVWTAGELARNPDLSWTELLARSPGALKIYSAWLFQTRNRRAQDLRLRIRFEQDAFAAMTPSWKRVGFPFDRLVPSLATAIGSSSDRPAALAELMGIIVNDGLLRPTLRFQDLSFAKGTPYETVFTPDPGPGRRVMAEPVARLLRQVLAEVVQRGTAIRDAKAFVGPHGEPVALGGKTGSGDNRFVLVGRGGVKLASRPVNRTATFVFYIGDRYFGVITAFVNGKAASDYRFTSSLPLAVLKTLAPAIQPHLSLEPQNTLTAQKYTW